MKDATKAFEYIGAGAALDDIPARSLSPKDVAELAARLQLLPEQMTTRLLTSGLYIEVDELPTSGRD